MAEDILKEAIAAFAECESAESDNRRNGLDDLRFARLGKQWPDRIRKQREAEGRPCLTINRLPAFLRQVLNDSRQNKPGISVHPVEQGDRETAEVIAGLIRNIEKTSNADIAYDTAVDSSATTGVGYIGVNLAYACDDTFEQDIVIKAKPNRFSIYGDPYSQCADSSDWNIAFEVEEMSEGQFRRKYPGAQIGDFGAGSWAAGWCNSQSRTARVAAYWKRSETVRKLVQWQAGEFAGVSFADELERIQGEYGSLTIGPSRPVKSYKVRQYLLTANELLSDTEWAGRYIPIIPVYGEEVNEEGKRHFRSLIHDARDSQQMLNFFRTNAAEIVAYAPRAPWIGPKGFARSDPRWQSANNVTHPYLEYDGQQAPQRTPFSGISPGDIQEAANAQDDMKAVLGLYDASLGARSNETSGRAIMVRQREGDVATFHLIDNLTRAIRHLGVVLIDLIPKIYSTERMIRVLGVDGKAREVALTGAAQEHDPAGRIYNLALGKYDLTVKAGPSYTTQREASLDMLTELVRAQPEAAVLLGDMIVELMDIPNGDKAVKRLQAMLPPQVKEAEADGDPTQQALQAQQAQFQQVIAQMQQALAAAQAEAQEAGAKVAIDARKLDIEEYKAVTDRMATAAQSAALTPEMVQQLVVTTLQDIIATSQEIPGGEGPQDVLEMGDMAPMQPQGEAEVPQP